MDLAAFERALARGALPDGLALALQVLWHDGAGDWERAHEIAQDMPGALGARLHAYLHRKEGDLGNARYWYGQAGARMPDGTLENEWRELVSAQLEAGGAR
jgi:hypothetical protein